MLSNFHKTTFQCLWRTPDNQKATHSLQKEVGQNIKHKKRDKRVRQGDPSWGGSHEGEVSKHQETLTGEFVGSFGISEGNITRRAGVGKAHHRLCAQPQLPVEM